MKFTLVLILIFFGWSASAFRGVANWAHSSAPTCGGVSIGGFCWYYGANGDSCTTTCATRGGYNTATETYAGYPAGSVGNCTAVLHALGESLFYWDNGLANNCTACGCHASPGSYMGRMIVSATTAGDSYSVMRRVCACNN